MNKKEMDFVMKALGSESLLPLELAAKRKLITYYAIRTAFLNGRSPAKEDEGVLAAHAIVIEYANRGENRRIEYAYSDQIDIEKITDSFIEYYSHRKGRPSRASREVPQIFLVSEDDTEAADYYRESVRHL